VDEDDGNRNGKSNTCVSSILEILRWDDDDDVLVVVVLVALLVLVVVDVLRVLTVLCRCNARRG
jgi:hypothetical protein